MSQTIIHSLNHTALSSPAQTQLDGAVLPVTPSPTMPVSIAKDTNSSAATKVTNVRPAKQAMPTTQMVSAKRAQQRQILALMGIEVWVQYSTETVAIDYTARLEAAVDSSRDTKLAAISSVSLTNPPANPATVHSMPIDAPSVAASSFESSPSLPQPSADAKPPASPSFDTNSADTNRTDTNRADKDIADNKLADKQTVNNLTGTPDTVTDADSALANAAISSPTSSPTQAVAFELLGVKYRHWVLLVDAHHLRETALTILWDNMLTGLSVKAERLKFPICAGISDVASAAASVAGFIFRIAKTENVQVAALTPMPQGVISENLRPLPQLSEMLQSGDKKRQLWQQLSQQ